MDFFQRVYGIIITLLTCGVEIVTHLIGYKIIKDYHNINIPYFSVVNNLVGVVAIMTIGLIVYAPYVIWEEINFLININTVKTKIIYLDTISRFRSRKTNCLLKVYIAYLSTLLTYLALWPPNIADTAAYCSLIFVELWILVLMPLIFMLPRGGLVFGVILDTDVLFSEIIIILLVIDCIVIFISHNIGFVILKFDSVPRYSLINQLVGLSVIIGCIIVFRIIVFVCYCLSHPCSTYMFVQKIITVYTRTISR